MVQKENTKQDDNTPDDWQEWQPTLGLRAAGFWNARPEYKGKVFEGILLGDVRTDGKGVKLKNPFYLFRLTKDLEKCWRIPSREAQEKGETPHEGSAKVGEIVGVSASAGLNGIMQKLGHGFKLKYEGKTPLPSDKSKSIHNFRMKVSPRPLIHVERNDTGNPGGDKGDADVNDDEIPF